MPDSPERIFSPLFHRSSLPLLPLLLLLLLLSPHALADSKLSMGMRVVALRNLSDLIPAGDLGEVLQVTNDNGTAAEVKFTSARHNVTEGDVKPAMANETAAASLEVLFPVGATVEIKGLKSAAMKEFNGLLGKVVGHKDRRVGVELPDPHGTKGFLADNVAVVGEKALKQLKVTDPPFASGQDTWPLTKDVARKGLPVIYGYNTTSNTFPTGRLFAEYKEEAHKDAWWVTPTTGGENMVVQMSDMRVRPAPGLTVTGEQGPSVLVEPYMGNDTTLLEERVWWTKLDTGKQVFVKLSKIEPLNTDSLESLPELRKIDVSVGDDERSKQYSVGDKVDVRDKENSAWKRGTVTAVQGAGVLVQVDGWKRSFQWKYMRPATDSKEDTSASAAVEIKLQVGDRVEVRDTDAGTWKTGTVAGFDLDEALVKVDGWRSPHKWKQVRKIEEEVKKPEMKETQEPAVNYTMIWESVCAKASCEIAGRAGDPECKDEYICGNVTGCSFDVLDVPPCSKRRLRIGDIVILHPLSHEQGSLRKGEPGTLLDDMRDDQPFKVRGPYSDTFFYKESELLPAWNKTVSWAPDETLSGVMVQWRGRPTFGWDAEALPGADYPNPGYGTVTDDDGPVPTAAATAAATAPKPPPQTPPPAPRTPPPTAAATAPPPPVTPPPVVTPPPAQPVTPPPAAPVTAAAAPLPPPVTSPPRPPPITPPPLVRPPPSRRSPRNMVGVIVVVSTEAPEVNGYYRVAGRFRGMTLYKSDSCASKTCVMFTSGGGYWMISEQDDGHTTNRGIVKTSEKTKGKKPDLMAAWEWHNPSSRSWEPATQTYVKTAEQMAAIIPNFKEIIEAVPTPMPVVQQQELPQQQQQQQQQSVAADPNAERRLDRDGKPYTKEEFIMYYGGTKEWEMAPPASSSGGAAAAAGAAASGAASSEEATFTKGETVVATRDITLGGAFTVKAGSPGTVHGRSGGASSKRWMVRFLGEFPMPVVISVDASDIKSTKK